MAARNNDNNIGNDETFEEDRVKPFNPAHHGGSAPSPFLNMNVSLQPTGGLRGDLETIDDRISSTAQLQSKVAAARRKLQQSTPINNDDNGDDDSNDDEGDDSHDDDSHDDNDDDSDDDNNNNSDSDTERQVLGVER